MTRHILAFAFLLALPLFLFLAPATGTSAEPLLPAPLSIEGWQTLNPSDASTEKPSPMLVVDFGSARPGVGRPPVVTIVGDKGTASGVLTETVRTCRYLCGEDNDGSCHYSGLYALDKTQDQIGTPLLALPGEFRIESLTKSSPEPASLPMPGEQSPLAWEPPGSPMEITTYQVMPAADGHMSLQADTGGIEEIYHVDGKTCAARKSGRLTSVTCDAFAALFEGSTPLLLSWPDYNTAKTDILASFTSGGRDYTVIRLGLKAQDVTGLIVQDGDKWIFLTIPRDYPSLC